MAYTAKRGDTFQLHTIPAAVEALGARIRRANVVGPIVPEATLRRARKGGLLAREMSERLYEVGRVVALAERIYHGDDAAMGRFMRRPHQLLSGSAPLDMARSSSAGAEAVINLLRRAEAGFAV